MEVANVDIGTLIAGKYRLKQRLGGGGMGEVFRAIHEIAGRVVALKLLKHDYAHDADLTRRFFLEAQAVNKIRHPNIVDVFDAGMAEEGPYVAMEYLEGASLAAALTGVGRVNLPTALAVVLPMLDALEGAHRHGIVHRDLKPENVFLAQIGEEGRAGASEIRVKLLDFGIAKVLDQPETSTSPRTNTGVIFGTPDYLSPEQASGESVVDGRSDVFSVGTVLFELLTGRRPFEAPTAVATAYRIVHAAAPTLASMGVAVPARIQEILERALAKNRDQRFETASSFADSLAEFVPDAGARRHALRALLEAVHMQPTQAAPAQQARPVASLSFEPSLPLPPPQGSQPKIPSSSGSVSSGMPPSAGWDAPPKVAAPAGPTMVSNAYVAPSPKVVPVREPMMARPSPGTSVRVPSRPEIRDSELQRVLSSRQAQAQSDRERARADSSGTLPAISSERGSNPNWAPRPLPSSTRGRLHTRGTLPRAMFKWVERAHGDKAKAAILELLPPSLADLFRTDGFNALVWYDLEASDTLLEAATFSVLGRDPAAWRKLARDNFDKDLAPIFRPTSQRGSDATNLLKRLPGSWSRVFDFGNPRIGEPKNGSMVLRIDGFEGASVALRYVVLGAIDGLLSAAPSACTIRVVAGEASFVRDFELEIGIGPR